MDIMKIKKLFFGSIGAAILFIALSGVSHAATSSTWIGGDDFGNSWNDPHNWSPAVVPTPGSDVSFSAGSANLCNINVPVTVNSITIDPSYTGAITQKPGTTVTVKGNFTEANGTFTGSSSDGDSITVEGDFSVSGGTFQSTLDDLTVGGSWNMAGTFQNNSGTVIFTPSSGHAATITGSTTFGNLQFGIPFAPLAHFTVATGTVLTVTGYLNPGANTDWNQFIGGGEIDAQGNIESHYASLGNAVTGTVSFVVNGLGTQLIGDTAVNGADASGLELPNLTITKTSGSVHLARNIFIYGNWTNTSSTLITTPVTSTVIFAAPLPQTVQITGSSTFYDLDFAALSSSAATTSVTIASATVLTATDGLGLYGDEYNITSNVGQPGNGVAILNGGTIDVKGGISWGNTENSNVANVGNTTIIVDGTSSQLIYGAASFNGGITTLLPNLTVNKHSGTLTLNRYFMVMGNWNVSTGTINPATSTVDFQVASATISGHATFNKLIFTVPYNGGLAATSTITLTTGTVLTVSTQLGLLGDATGCSIPWSVSNSTLILNGGEIDVQGTDGGLCWNGNVSLSYDGALSFGNTESSASGGTTKLVMDGTSTQEIGNGGEYQTYLPTFVVSTTPGVFAYVTNECQLTFTGMVSVSSGELRIASDTPDEVTSCSGPRSVIFTATTTVASGAVFSDYDQASATLEFASSIINNGTVFFDGSGEGCTNTLPNYIMLRPVSATSPKQDSWSGGGNFVMRYVDASYQSSTIPITVYNGTDSGNNSNWIFQTASQSQLVQSVSSANSGANKLVLPAFGFWPRAGDLIVVAVSARNQGLVAPTDSAGNTYTLVASSTFGLSPLDALGLYYAKNVSTTSPFVVTANGTTQGAPSYLSASAFEYTGMAPSTTFDGVSASTLSPPSTSTLVTSLGATGGSSNELYFGTATINASTTLTAGPGWTPELGVADNTSYQALYTEDMTTMTIPPVAPAANWTAATGTSCAAIMGIFHSPFTQAYVASGTLDSAPFDTGVASGAQLNSVLWRGTAPNGSYVGFQFATSTAPGGPWSFVGPDGTSNSYFPSGGSMQSGIPISVAGNSGGYNMFNGFRYFRYRILLHADPNYEYSPTVNQVVVNWSP